MNSKISTELIVVIVAIVIFYLRVAMLRGQKSAMKGIWRSSAEK